MPPQRKGSVPKQKNNSQSKGMMQRLGSGKDGRFGKTAALTAMLGSQATGDHGASFKDAGINDQASDKSKMVQVSQAPSAQNNRFALPEEMPETQKRREFEQAKRQDAREPLASRATNAAATGAQVTGAGMQAAGATGQAASKAGIAASRGAGAASKGLQQGGAKLTEAGARLSSTGLGAIAGVPLMAAGGAATAVGAGGQAAAKGGEAVSRGAGAASKGLKESGKDLKDSAQSFKHRLEKMKLAARNAKLAKSKISGLADLTQTSTLFKLSLGLAAAKDGWDLLTEYFDAGITGIVINFGITTAFAIVLLMQGKTLGSTKRVARYGIAALVEFLPLISYLPFWTIAVVYDKMKKNKPDK